MKSSKPTIETEARAAVAAMVLEFLRSEYRNTSKTLESTISAPDRAALFEYQDAVIELATFLKEINHI